MPRFVSVMPYLCARKERAKIMKRKTKEQKPISLRNNHSVDLLTLLNQPCDLADLWGRAARSFPQNRRKQNRRTVIALVVGVIIGALAMHFLASPERWIRF